MELSNKYSEHFDAIESIDSCANAQSVIDVMKLTHDESELSAVNDANELDQLCHIENLCQRILASNALGFDINTNGMGRLQVRPTRLGRLHKQFSQLPTLRQLQLLFPCQEMSPYVTLLLKALEGQEWHDVPPSCVMSDGRYAGEHFNRTLIKIRNAAGTKVFKNKARIWSGMCSENFTGTVKYVDYLFSRHSKLLVVRLDLTFKMDPLCQTSCRL